MPFDAVADLRRLIPVDPQTVSEHRAKALAEAPQPIVGWRLVRWFSPQRRAESLFAIIALSLLSMITTANFWYFGANLPGMSTGMLTLACVCLIGLSLLMAAILCIPLAFLFDSINAHGPAEWRSYRFSPNSYREASVGISWLIGHKVPGPIA